MEIRIEKLKSENFKQLYKFELENKAYFEQTVPSRGADYYNFEIFKMRNATLLNEQVQELSYFYRT